MEGTELARFPMGRGNRVTIIAEVAEINSGRTGSSFSSISAGPRYQELLYPHPRQTYARNAQLNLAVLQNPPLSES